MLPLPTDKKNQIHFIATLVLVAISIDLILFHAGKIAETSRTMWKMSPRIHVSFTYDDSGKSNNSKKKPKKLPPTPKPRPKPTKPPKPEIIQYTAEKTLDPWSLKNVESKSKEKYIHDALKLPNPYCKAKVNIFKNYQKSTDIYAIILSKQSNFKIRNTIRNTFAKHIKHYKFLVGGSYCKIKKEFLLDLQKLRSEQQVFENQDSANDHLEACFLNQTAVDLALKKDANTTIYEENKTQEDLQKYLRKENARHKDLYIIPDLVDSYYNLTSKVKSGIAHIFEHYYWYQKNKTGKKEGNGPFPRWIMKVDDDEVVLFPEMENYLKNTWQLKYGNNGKNDPEKRPILAGRISQKVKIKRLDPRNHKWGEMKYVQPGNTFENTTDYPKYAQGACGYLISRYFANWINTNSENITNYTAEDTSMGIWAEKLDYLEKNTKTNPNKQNPILYHSNHLSFENIVHVSKSRLEKACSEIGLNYVFSLGHKFMADDIAYLYDCYEKNKQAVLDYERSKWFFWRRC